MYLSCINYLNLFLPKTAIISARLRFSAFPFIFYCLWGKQGWHRIRYLCAVSYPKALRNGESGWVVAVVAIGGGERFSVIFPRLNMAMGVIFHRHNTWLPSKWSNSWPSRWLFIAVGMNLLSSVEDHFWREQVMVPTMLFVWPNRIENEMRLELFAELVWSVAVSFECICLLWLWSWLGEPQHQNSQSFRVKNYYNKLAPLCWGFSVIGTLSIHYVPSMR